MTCLLLLNGLNALLYSAIQSNGKMLDNIIAADSRVRALAMPTPNIPSAFMGLLPVNTIENLKTVENRLFQSSVEIINCEEKLVTIHFIFFFVLQKL